MTLIEVAKKAGVSKSVVSDILSRDTKCSYRAETIERVRRAAQQFGYRPHSAASLMRANHTYMLGIFSSSLRGSCSALMTEALVSEVKKHPPYKPMIIDPAMLREDADGAFGFELLEGLFWSLSRRDDDVLRSLLDRPDDRPQVVTIGPEYPQDLPVSHVVAGLGDGAFQAVDYLLKLGHRRIAIIYRAPRRSNDRFNGYKRALKEHGLPLDPALCWAMPNEFGLDSYYQAGSKLLQERYSAAAPTAIFCHNDEVAIGALKGASQLGLIVPDDLSVMGFDGVPIADYVQPTLSTVRQPIQKQAAAAVEMVLAQLNGRACARGELRKLACELRIGESTATPRQLI